MRTACMAPKRRSDVTRLAGLTLVAMLTAASVAGAAPSSAGPAAATPPAQAALGAPIELTGQWDFLPGQADQDVAADPAKFTGWQPVSVPGNWVEGRHRFAWQLKRFTVPADVKGLDCELLFERVQWSATVWLNGKKLGGWPDGYVPFRLLAGDAIKPGAENVLLVRVGGFDEVPKAKSGPSLFPAGFATMGRGGGGGIKGRVFVRFFKTVRLTRAQVLPDLATSTAKVSVRVEGAAPEAAVELIVRETPDAREAGRATATVKLAGGVGEAVIPVAVKDVKPWEIAQPFLYRLDAMVRVAGQPADVSSERFGMREVATRPDGFTLNGRKVRLLGTNIIGDMGYWRGAPNLFGHDKIKQIIVDPARAMNAVCIRTHTAPIPKWWLDVCDEEGLLVLLEFAVTVNCAKIDFEPAELAAFQKNLMDEAAALVPYLANHPSVVMWVPTNESNNWHEWERTTLFEHFKKLDPSRPTIRASYDTPDARDIHSYAAMWKGSDGDFEFRCRREAERARRDKTPPMVTEYLGGMDLRVTRKWFGPAADSNDSQVRERLAGQVAEFYAARAMEQTEAARRLGYVCILPFGPGFFGAQLPPENRPPVFHAVANALAPVGVSIDQANRNLVTGQQQKTAFCVMNDTAEKVKAILTVNLMAADCGFDPRVSAVKPLREIVALDVEVEAHSVLASNVVWLVPAEEGRYVLLARLERAGAAPVISRRDVLAIKREPAPKSLAGKKVLVVEVGDKKLSTWIGRQDCQLVDPALIGQAAAAPGQPPAALAEAQLVVIGPRAGMGEAFKTLAGQLPGYVQKGGRVLVLEQVDWPRLKDLFGVQIERTDYDYDDNNAPADQRTDSGVARASESQASGGSSRVFRWEQPDRAIWKGIPDEYLFRWNGQHGRVARVSMSTLPGRARVLVKYAEAERDDLKFVPVAAVPHGQGEVLYFMLQLDGRYDPADPDYDPIVERLMLNLLGL